MSGSGYTGSASGRGDVDVSCLDRGPFLLNPLAPRTGSFSAREGSWEDPVAAVRVSMGGGRMGAATREEDVEEVVALDREEEVEALR